MGHFLSPVLKENNPSTFAYFGDETSQRLWAKNHGMKDTVDLCSIAYAQLENSSAETFYNGYLEGVSKQFLKRMPGNIKYKVLWHASAGFTDAMEEYDCVV